jgi:anhydro-N-acetylmuramic acid kinase
MRVIGLISGTSVDGIDGVMVDIRGQGYDLTLTVMGGHTTPYPFELQQAILQVCAGQPITLPHLADLDDAIAASFAQAAQALMDEYGPVDLVASHGQTVFHRPPQGSVHALGYSLQLGRGAAIAAQLGCPTISNFRAADMAQGGEGAPLVPPIDAVLLADPDHSRCVQNIGGIGNVTYLPPREKLFAQAPPAVLGWDTGPGNSLLDLAVQHFSNGHQSFDAGGQWAAQGQPDPELVDHWLRHPTLTSPRPNPPDGSYLAGSSGIRLCKRLSSASLPLRMPWPALGILPPAPSPRNINGGCPSPLTRSCSAVAVAAISISAIALPTIYRG